MGWVKSKKYKAEIMQDKVIKHLVKNEAVLIQFGEYDDEFKDFVTVINIKDRYNYKIDYDVIINSKIDLEHVMEVSRANKLENKTKGE